MNPPLVFADVVSETPLSRAVRLLDIGSHELCDYLRSEENICIETPGLDLMDWCDNCRITEALRILREEVKT